MNNPQPRYRVGQRIVVNTAFHKDTVAIVRQVRVNEDGEDFYVVDLDKPSRRQEAMGRGMGIPVDARNVTGTAAEAGR